MYKEYYFLNKPNINTKFLSILTIIFFISAILFGGYLISYQKGQIDDEHFTISRSLANGNKPIMIVFVLLALITNLLLNYVRGGKKELLYLRYFLIFVSYSLIISIMYLTVAFNKSLHFKLAGTIFLFQVLVVFIISYLFNNYLDKDNDLLIPIDLNNILIIVCFTLLLIFGIFDPSDTCEFRNAMFASSENAMVLLNFIPILYLGFI